MNKGVVMEVMKRKVVILTPDGEFVTREKREQNYTVGEEIFFPKEEIQRNKTKMALFPFYKPVAFLAACLLCLFFWSYKETEKTALAYVSIDINPSIEASVDDDLEVIQLVAYNEDGKRIVQQLDNWKHEQLPEVIRSIIRLSQKNGYLTADKEVRLTSVIANTEKKKENLRVSQALQELQKTYTENSIAVIYEESTLELRDSAKKAGLSVGNYIKRLKQEEKPEEKEHIAPVTPQQEPPSAIPSPSKEEQPAASKEPASAPKQPLPAPKQPAVPQQGQPKGEPSYSGETPVNPNGKIPPGKSKEKDVKSPPQYENPAVPPVQHPEKENSGRGNGEQKEKNKHQSSSSNQEKYKEKEKKEE
ncbi:MAG: anti-sigma factor domain-containing protein [Ectobacillus sp.]